MVDGKSDQDPDRHQNDADSQHWLKGRTRKKRKQDWQTPDDCQEKFSVVSFSGCTDFLNWCMPVYWNWYCFHWVVRRAVYPGIEQKVTCFAACSG
jgi:hypothetical protein